MINLKTLRAFAAASTFAALLGKKIGYVVGSEATAILRLARAPIGPSNAGQFASAVRISGNPSSENSFRLLGVLFLPPFHFCAMTKRIIRATFARPHSLKSWVRVFPPFIDDGATRDAASAGSPSLAMVAVSARLASRVTRLAIFTRSDARRMFRLLLGPSLACLTRAYGTAIVGDGAFCNVTVPTGLTREVVFLASRYRRQSFWNRLHAIVPPQTILIVVRA